MTSLVGTPLRSLADVLDLAAEAGAAAAVVVHAATRWLGPASRPAPDARPRLYVVGGSGDRAEQRPGRRAVRMNATASI